MDNMENIKTVPVSVQWVIVVGVVFFIGYFVGSPEEVVPTYSAETCSVAGIAIRGTLLSYIPPHPDGDPAYDYDLVSSENVIWFIDEANARDNIKAILVEVTSPGGSPVAGEEISRAIKESQKPVAAFVRDIGTSAAYWAITGADKIFASKNSDVGSIGVSMSYLNNVERNRNEGLDYEDLSVGKYKDAGSPDVALTQEEKAMFLRDLNIIYENFIAGVAENRNLSVEKVKSVADGASVLGEKAKELGLIDEIGGMPEALKYLEETTGEELEVCWQ